MTKKWNDDYLVGDIVGHQKKFPFLTLNVSGDICIPPRSVFQLLHKHEEVEFILVIKNKLTVKTSTNEVTIGEGEAVFIPKNVLHIIDTHGSCECRVFLFPDVLLLPYADAKLYKDIKKFTENPNRELVVIDNQHQHESVIDKLMLLNTISCDYLDDPLTKFRLLAILFDLWYEFSNKFKVDFQGCIEKQSVRNTRLKNYLAFIQLNYYQAITVTDIASSGFTSVSECNRIFKQYLSTTAYDYLIQYRINKSCEAMKQSSQSLSEIAFAVGYNSHSHFSKHFKRYMNISPGEYQRLWTRCKSDKKVFL